MTGDGSWTLFFILRCAFWLSIVYASILSPGLFHGDLSLTSAAPNSAAFASKVAAASKTIAVARDLCQGRAAQCLDDAAQLTALLQKAIRDGDGAEDWVPAVERFDDEGAPQRVVSPRSTHKERLARAP